MNNREAYIQATQSPDIKEIIWLVYFFENDVVMGRFKFHSRLLAEEFQRHWVDHKIWF